MPNPEEHFSRYCDQVCAHVRFRPDHPAIRAELMAHLEDRYYDLRARCPALDAGAAKRQVLSAMGDPESTGRALDAIHTPALGWAQIAARALVCAVVALIAVFSLFSLDGTRRFFSMFARNRPRPAATMCRSAAGLMCLSTSVDTPSPWSRPS